MGEEWRFDMEKELDIAIAKHQQRIQDLKEIQERIKDSETEKIRFKVESKHWHGYSEPILCKVKNKILIDKYTAKLILDIAIKVEKQKRDNLIDIEIIKRKVKKRKMKND